VFAGAIMSSDCSGLSFYFPHPHPQRNLKGERLQTFSAVCEGGKSGAVFYNLAVPVFLTFKNEAT
jgi:hypothetical protein